MNQNALSLYDFCCQIRETVQEAFPFSYWITAEIAELRENTQGHCFIELVEKKEHKIVAKARATIWSNNFYKIKTLFYQSTGTEIQQGMKVMFNVLIEMHEVFGFSLNILSVNPAYTLGEMAQKRHQIIQQLMDDGVIEMNKELTLSTPVQRIAVISAEKAAGYEDFMNQLINNPHGFYYSTTLFPALMQGEQAPLSIIHALEKIHLQLDKFDVVVLIRGGGSSLDLSCFDDYDLALHVAQFPIPVITGIGHERDDTVADLVAHCKLKTPTAVAEFMINLTLENENQLSNMEAFLLNSFSEKQRFEEQRLNHLIQKFEFETQFFLSNQEKKLEKFNYQLQKMTTLRLEKAYQNIAIQSKRIELLSLQLIASEKKLVQQLINKLTYSTGSFFKIMTAKLDLLTEKIKANSHEAILQKGYSITLKDGKTVKSSAEIQSGDCLETILKTGKIKSVAR